MPAGGWNRGLTKETDDRVAKSAAAIAAAHTGVPLSPEHIAALSVAKIGIPKSTEHVNALIEAFNCPTVKLKRSVAQKEAQNRPLVKLAKSAELKEVWQDPEYRIKHCGENHPNWKNGIGKLPYPFEFTKQLKESIRERDNHICQLCGKTEQENGRKLDVHHIDYNKDNLDWFNLISLCRSCHTKTSWNREYWIEKFVGVLI